MVWVIQTFTHRDSPTEKWVKRSAGHLRCRVIFAGTRSLAAMTKKILDKTAGVPEVPE